MGDELPEPAGTAAVAAHVAQQQQGAGTSWPSSRALTARQAAAPTACPPHLEAGDVAQVGVCACRLLCSGCGKQAHADCEHGKVTMRIAVA